jgi:hypothetical protein
MTAISLFLALPAAPAQALTAAELFVMLPPDQVRSLDLASRQELLEKAHQGNSGYSAPSKDGYWLEIHGDNALTMFGMAQGPVVIKLFPMVGNWNLATICRSRQTHGPASIGEIPHETYLDLVLFLINPVNDVVKVNIDEYLPPINVLDFITPDTLEDRSAVRDLQVINQQFADCLTCHASTQDPLALDIFTVTSINGHSCAHFMAQFKLLPLKWEKDRFTKPYDRAAPHLQYGPQKPPPQGLYYHEPIK